MKNGILFKNWNYITKIKLHVIGKYFEHLEEPNKTDDISQQLYSKAKEEKRIY